MRVKALSLAVLLGAVPAQAATLNRGNGGEPNSLDPHFVGGTYEANIVGDLLTGLTTLDAAARPIPGAADHWEVSPDGLIWTFHLRDEVWSDGVPVTAGDFVFAWQRLLDPKTAARNPATMWVVKNGRAVSAGKLPPSALGVTAKDAHTLIVRLEHPAPYLPELLTLDSADPLPAHLLAAKGAGWAKPGMYVGNGAYSLKEWVPNDHITLVKNPLFYDAARVRIDTVIYYPTADAEAALKRYRAGELDTQTPVPIQEIGWLRAHLKNELHITPSLALSYIAINLDDPPLKDVRVRRALNLAYDREAVVQKVLKLGEAPAYGIVPPGMANFPGGGGMDISHMPQPARLAEAQKLMQAAGYGPFNRLRLTYNTWPNPDVKRLAAIFQAMCRPLYIDIDIQVTDLAVLMQNLRQRHFELSAASWYADYNDAANFLDLLRADSPNNYAHYRNPAFDTAMDAAEAEIDPGKRGDKLRAAEKIALTDYPWIPIRFAVQSDLVKPIVKGWVPNIKDYQRSRWLGIEK
jgi:oligopeptide transport system substrate-binding protein